ncbi:MAG: hypothetical protein JO332_03830, partial [Planctomycetaceae bacterium]|nr:hypothetical protein [Planctomycetaceae bacterium]
MKKLFACILLVSGCGHAGPDSSAPEGEMDLTLRSRSKSGDVTTEHVLWYGPETAFIVCDMWDDHWCKGAARRVGELAVPMNRVLKAAREHGCLIVHAPSS